VIKYKYIFIGERNQKLFLKAKNYNFNNIDIFEIENNMLGVNKRAK
jgi:hypothetical protein